MDRTLIALVVALVLALVIFALWPGLDLAVAHWAYEGGGFLGQTENAAAARDFFRVSPILLLVALVLAWVAKRFGFPVPFAPTGRGALFMIATMAIGPGLIVNFAMKDHLHRPRPAHVQEFGGTDEFKPWYRFDGACQKNCGFASGEASQGFWMVAPALLTPPPVRLGMIAAAIEFGIATSVLRIEYGGHFLSDTVVGALISLIVVFGLKNWFWPRGSP
jgi:lipid A 4'-phosphatase